MRGQKMTTERVSAFSDAVLAVIITIMVLELKAPEEPTIAAILPLWPTLVSYALSYLFIAIIWVNHHHLFRLVHFASPRLIWINFVHLFLVSLLPFTTAWMATTDLAPVPVATYAAVFVLVNLAYLLFEREILAHADATAMPEQSRRLARRRTLVGLATFAAAGLVAPAVPLLGFALICCALFLYLRPEIFQGRQQKHPN
ncbi:MULTISPECIES: TMEM175 family protein [unclassified Sinorhizobium]|uniref:TMEM175 family protein n=1 Tax=unclassified Sinorhizobium TaxID=2613772 RepID=UPI003523152D